MKIGDRFMKGKLKAEVVDIIKCWSTKHQEWTGEIYIAKLIDGLTTNSWEVSKATVVRWRI